MDSHLEWNLIFFVARRRSTFRFSITNAMKRNGFFFRSLCSSQRRGFFSRYLTRFFFSFALWFSNQTARPVSTGKQSENTFYVNKILALHITFQSVNANCMLSCVPFRLLF